MSLSSDSDNDTSIRSASSKEEEEEKDPQKEAFCKNFERMFGGSQIAIGPGKINMRLMSAQSDETSAVRRLLQFKIQGKDAWYGLNVMRELEKPDRKTPHIEPGLKKRLQRIIKSFSKRYQDEKCPYNWSSKDENTWEHWTPILWNYELYKGHTLNKCDMGELVFANYKKNQFVLVNLCGPRKSADGKQNYEEDYEARLLAQAHRFLALVYYLPIGNVKWVRATYITDEHPQLHPKLFDYSLPTQPAQDNVPPLFHLTPAMVKQCLTAKDLSVLDTFVTVCDHKPPSEGVKQRLRIPEGACDPTAIELKYLDVNLGQSPLEKKCDGCDRFFPAGQLKACSACRSVLYCSKECQKASWRLHKMGLCR